MLIDGGARTTALAAARPGERNLISGNGRRGVIIRGSGTMSNTVSGNYIGTNAAGTAAISNTEDGVVIEERARRTTALAAVRPASAT